MKDNMKTLENTDSYSPNQQLTQLEKAVIWLANQTNPNLLLQEPAPFPKQLAHMRPSSPGPSTSKGCTWPGQIMSVVWMGRNQTWWTTSSSRCSITRGRHYYRHSTPLITDWRRRWERDVEGCVSWTLWDRSKDCFGKHCNRAPHLKLVLCSRMWDPWLLERVWTAATQECNWGLGSTDCQRLVARWETGWPNIAQVANRISWLNKNLHKWFCTPFAPYPVPYSHLT